MMKTILAWSGRHKWATAFIAVALLLTLLVVAAIIGAYVSAVLQHLKTDHDNLHVLVQDYIAHHPQGAGS